MNLQSFILCLFVPITILNVATGQTLSGIVFDIESREEVIGASVIFVENPTVGASTDLDGKFNLRIPKGHKYPLKIKAQMIGYETVIKVLNEDDISNQIVFNLNRKDVLLKSVLVTTVTLRPVPPDPSIETLNIQDIPTFLPDTNDEDYMLWLLRTNHIIY